MKKTLVALAMVVCASLGTSGAASAVASGAGAWLVSSWPNARAYANYTDGSGSVRAFQTCVSGGHGTTYYSAWESSKNTNTFVGTWCAISSISNYSYQVQ